MELKNDRGIFIVNIFRAILMKMVFIDEYNDIDHNMSDSNVGGRKKKSIRNHIFIINGVINEVLRNKNKSIDIQVLDYSQCFDTLSLEECINDLYDTSVKNRNLTLMYKANENNLVAIKTPFVMTECKIEKIVLQGEVMAPLM